jgi:hypothetical protein
MTPLKYPGMWLCYGYLRGVVVLWVLRGVDMLWVFKDVVILWVFKECGYALGI